MTLVRVVSFEGVSSARMEEMRREIEGNPRSDDIPATEMLFLHDPQEEKALAVLFFESEEDYERADQTLSAMPADETPGSRTSVNRYEVAMRQTV